MRAATFPESWRDNPFLSLLETSLARCGVEFQKVGSDYLSVRWLFRQRGRVQILHFHWLHYHYQRSTALAAWLALGKFNLQLILAKTLGYKIVWTMHNWLPHDRQHRFLDATCYLIFAHISDSVVTLCNQAAFPLAEKYRRRKNVFSGYLGHYADCYPNDITQTNAREILKIPAGGMVFLFFGAVRPYKGIEELIISFGNLQDPDARLIISGKANDLSYQKKIQSSAEKDGRILAISSWIPDDEIQVYFNACDFVVLPFTDVMTSSSALLALGFGRAVVAPSTGCLPEIITPETGLLYDPSQDGSLTEALRRCYALDAVEMGERARQSVLRYTWEELAQVTMQAYS